MVEIIATLKIKSKQSLNPLARNTSNKSILQKSTQLKYVKCLNPLARNTSNKSHAFAQQIEVWSFTQVSQSFSKEYF